MSPVWLVRWLQIPAMVRVSRRAGTAVALEDPGALRGACM